MSFKKVFCAILLFFCMMIFGGCTSKNEYTVVQFASWGSKSEIDILKPILKAFEIENPNIKIEFMHIPQNYFQKIHLLFASNTAPDVIFINNLNLPIYANVLEPLEIPTFEVYPQALQALSYNGKLYAIPRDVSNLVVFYNKNLFNKKGLEYPQKSWTLDEFLEIAQHMTDENVFGVSFEEDPLFYLPYLMSNGGGFLPEEINSKESQEALNFYADLRNKYAVAPKKFESASATMAQMFLQGKLAMYISGRWMVPKLREEASFDWDIVNFPSGEKGSIVQLDASGWAISKSSIHKQEARKLVEFLASKTSISQFSQSGLIVPARKDCADIILDGNKPLNSRVFLDVIKYSKPTPVNEKYNQIIDELKKTNEPLFNKILK